MATSREKSARNGAAAGYLRTLRVTPTPKITYRQIEERSGIPFETVKRLMNNKSGFTMDSFLAIAGALGADDATALRALSQIVGKKDI